MADFPKVVVLDLDGTIWTPEMYELWGGGGAPFSIESNDELRDKAGTRVRLYDGVALAVRDSIRASAILGVASTTDEPKWAIECMSKFVIEMDETRYTLHELFRHNSEIYKGLKRNHLKAIKERTGVEFEDILFVDNEYGNIRTVEALGVCCYYASDGLTARAWREALHKFRKTT